MTEKPDLAPDERILDEQDYVEGQSLVSDGNSRWARAGDRVFLLANAHYRAPDDEENS